MAINFIDVDRASKFGGTLVELANALRRARELATAASERMSHMNDGANFAPIAVSYGLTPQSSAVGQSAFGVVNDVLTALDAAAVKTVIERVG